MCMSMHPVVTRTRHWCISIRKVKFSRSLCQCRPFRSDGVNSDLVPAPLARPRPPTGTGTFSVTVRIGRPDRPAGSHTIAHPGSPPPVRWNVARRLPARSFRPHAPSLARSRLLASCLRRPRSIHQTAYHTHTHHGPGATQLGPSPYPVPVPSSGPHRKAEGKQPNEPQWRHIHTYVQNTHRK